MCTKLGYYQLDNYHSSKLAEHSMIRKKCKIIRAINVFECNIKLNSTVAHLLQRLYCGAPLCYDLK